MRKLKKIEDRGGGGGGGGKKVEECNAHRRRVSTQPCLLRETISGSLSLSLSFSGSDMSNIKYTLSLFLSLSLSLSFSYLNGALSRLPMSDTKSAKNGIAFDAINAMTRTPVVIAVHVSWARQNIGRERRKCDDVQFNITADLGKLGYHCIYIYVFISSI